MNSGYTFDDIDFLDEWNVQVQDVSGHLDMPVRKTPTEINLGRNDNGVVAFTDEDDIRFEGRDLKLKCYLKESSEENALIKLAALKSFITQPGMHSLVLKNAYNTYRIYHRSKTAVNIANKWVTNGINVLQFDIIFREAKPVSPLLTRGLVGHWSLEQADEDGGQQTDLSGYGNDADLINTAYTTDRKAAANSAMQFNGADAYVDTNDTFQSTFRDSFTFSIWCKPDDGQPAGAGCLFGIYIGGDDFYITNETNGTIQSRYRANVIGVYALTNSAFFSNGVEDWHHIVVRVDNDRKQIDIFGDGVKLTLSSSTGYDGDLTGVDMSTYTNTKDPSIGAMNNNNVRQNYFDGNLHDPRIYNRALSAEEIKLLYKLYDGAIDW